MSVEVELARTAERLEHVAEALRDVVESTEKKIDDHEARLRLLERMVIAIPPALILGVAGVVAEIIRG